MCCFTTFSARPSPAGSPRRVSTSTCAPAASSRSRGGGFDAEPDRLPRQQQCRFRAGAGGRRGVGRIIVDSFTEIERLVGSRHRRDGTVMLRVTAGVEAHTHEYIATAHEDQKFGFSIAEGEAAEAIRRVMRLRLARADRSALPHRQADLRHIRVRGGCPAGAASPAGQRRARHRPARARPRRWFRHRLHHPGRPADPAQLAERARARSSSTSAALSASAPRCRSSRAEPSSALDLHLLRGGHRQGRRAGRQASRIYVAVDGGMSDNIRPALYDADYSCTLASRHRAPRRCCRESSASTASPATSW